MPVYHGIEKDDNLEEVGMLKLVKWYICGI